jgi:hypothetical protein
MTFTQLKNQALNEYYPAFFLENFWPRGRGRHLLQALRVVWSVLLFTGALVFAFSTSNPAFDPFISKIFGGFILVFCLWMGAAAIHAFYNAYYFKSQSEESNEKPVLSYELGRILYQTSEQDILYGFLQSREGYEIMLRTGITQDEVEKFISNRSLFITADSLILPENDYVTASDYAGALMDADKNFAQLLFAHGVQKKDFMAIAEWVFEREIANRAKTRWWSREVTGPDSWTWKKLVIRPDLYG